MITHQDVLLRLIVISPQGGIRAYKVADGLVQVIGVEKTAVFGALGKGHSPLAVARAGENFGHGKLV